VRLAAPVQVSAVSIDHVAASVAYDQSSAPRMFSVLGYEDAQASGRAIELGEFEYSLAGGVVQTFTVTRAAVPIRAVVLDIASNHGAKFTCLYRFRVHGIAQSEQVVKKRTDELSLCGRNM
jgi:SUN domain-containing protein 1/2